MSHESTIRDLRAKAKQLEGHKRELDKQVEAIHSTIRIFEQSDSSIGVIPTTSPYAETLTKMMCDILSEEGALHRQIIYDRIKERGVHVGGQKPVNTIGSYLSVDPRFSNVGRGMWDLTRGPKEDVSAEIDNNGHLLLQQESSATATER